MKNKLLMLLALGCLTEESVAGVWDAGFRLNTLGYQAEVAHRFNKTFALRLQGGAAEFFKRKYEYDDAVYEKVRINPASINLYADWYFLVEWWRLSVGVGYNMSKFRLNRDLSKETNDARHLSQATQRFRYKKRLSEYVGTGFDFRDIFGSRWIFSFDFGVHLNSKVKSKLEATGPGSANPLLMETCKRAGEKIVNDFWVTRTYPAISIGFKYRLNNG